MRRFVVRSGFALLELVIVIGILSVITGLSIPAYREYQIRSDLDKTAQQVTQGLGRAKLLAVSGERDAGWGFYVPSGTLYKGTSYAERDTAFDEVYPMPSTIAVTGLLDIAFSRVAGDPSDTGDIVLRALNNDSRIIQVTIAVDRQSLAANQADLLTICHHGAGGSTDTITIPDATWPYHQSHGDTNGPCAGAASSSAASVASPSSVASSSSSSAASSAPACSKFTIAANQTITLTAVSSVTFQNVLSQITFGTGGPVVPVHVCYSTNNGSSMSPLFGGSGQCSGNGNAYGNAVQPSGTDTRTVSISNGSSLLLRMNGRYSTNGWLAFNQTFMSNDQTGQIILLRDGDTLAGFSGFGSQTALQTYLTSHGMLDGQGKIVLTSCQILAVTELSTLNSSGADFMDDVLVMSFN